MLIIAAGVGFGAYKLYTKYEASQPASVTQERPESHRRDTQDRPRVERSNSHEEGFGNVMDMVGKFAGVDPHAFHPQQDQAPPLAEASTAGGAMAVYYSPWQNLEAIDYNEIVQSRCSHLDIAAYAFTDFKLGEAVLAFARSGRPVRIYRDRDQYEQETRRGSRVAELFEGNHNISIRVKNSSVLMHLKAWSDGCVLREGSANWSPSGEKQQDNTLTLTTDPVSIHNFEAGFQAIWNRADNVVVQ